MKNSIHNMNSGPVILRKMVQGIQENKNFLAEVDGLIGDGDHGMNMSKGFTLFQERYGDSAFSLSDGMKSLGLILMEEIGGSMGPIYGAIFVEASDSIEALGKEEIDLKDLARCLKNAYSSLCCIVEAKPGDKTLIDTLFPAIESLTGDADTGISMFQAMQHMQSAALEGRDSTKNMTAKFGRSSRLKERSRGVLDAGACSCYIILHALAEGVCQCLQEGNNHENCYRS